MNIIGNIRKMDKTRALCYALGLVPIILFMVLFVEINIEASAGSESNHPNMYLNINEIEDIRQKIINNQEPWKTSYDKFISQINNSLDTPIQSVTYQGNSEHDYYAEAPYCGWKLVDDRNPDCIDGRVNPNADRRDNDALIILGKAVRNLGLAYALTGNPIYADKAIQLINGWAIDTSTMMNPRFTNDQSRIDLSTTIPDIFYGADLIWNYPGWNSADKNAFKEWTAEFVNSAKNWSSDNNFENWRLVFISTGSIIAEDVESRNYAFDRWKNIISDQMNVNGSMKYEIKRNNSLSYSAYAINAMIQTAEIARHYNVDLYNYKLPDGRGLEKTLDFHAPYIINPSTWTYIQTYDYKGAEASIYELAYSFKQKSSYIGVINKWKRPMYEMRIIGPITLTHGIPDIQTSFTHPSMFLNTNEIENIKEKIRNNREPWKTAYDEFMPNANAALNMPIQSVTYAGTIPQSGDIHDYWTDLPYSSDGVYNPNADRTDYDAAQKMKNAVRDLGLAYVLTGDSRYANKAVQLINAWAIDPVTKMSPKYINDQSRIELSITIPAMFYGADLIWNYPGWNNADKDAFKEWTAEFINSAKTWSRSDNYDSWRMAFISSAAIITEDSKSLDYTYNRWKQLIPIQISSEGKMVTELQRTRSLFYSLYGIDALIQTAEIARHRGVDLYNYKTSDGRSIELALDFHAPYASGSQTWPYEEIRWDLIDYSLFEFAYSFKQKDSYNNVITVRGRPMYEKRITGPVTLTHANIDIDVVKPIPSSISTPKPDVRPDRPSHKIICYVIRRNGNIERCK